MPLNIPDTNLFIYSFSGGLGRNVTKKANQPFSLKNIKPSPEANNWLFMGGMRLATAPPQLLDCVPLQLTVGFPQLSFSLYGKCKILEGPTITSTIEFNPLRPLFKFTSQTRFDLYGVIKVQGGMEVFAGKENGKPAVYVAIGWPYPENAVGFSMLNGKIYGRYSLYGYASSNTVEVKANAGAGLNVGIFRGEIEGELNFLINADPFLSGQVMAEGEIDVWVGAVGASGELAVQVYYKKPKLHYDGEVSAWVKIWGKRMEISKDVRGDIPL